jgi:phosphate/sulfate permease
LEFVKWFRIFGRKQTSVEGVLISLIVSTISGILIALLGVSMIKKGIFDIYTEKLGKQIDSQIIKKKKK